MNPLVPNSQNFFFQHQDMQPVNPEEDPLQNQQTNIESKSPTAPSAQDSSDEVVFWDGNPIDYNSQHQNMRRVGENQLQRQYLDDDTKPASTSSFFESFDQVYSTGEIAGPRQRIFEPKCPIAPEITFSDYHEKQRDSLPDIADPLPDLTGSFRGRKKVLEQLEREFQKKGLVIATPITGPKGIGKTQAALQLLKQLHQKENYDHIVWISAESEEKIFESFIYLANELEIGEGKKASSRVALLKNHLRKKYCLYVFDDAPNFESIKNHLPNLRTRRSHILITSRNSRGWNTGPIILSSLAKAVAIPSIAFGAEKWAEYFGDVGVEPPLPKDIDIILNSPCPYWNGKRVKETHMLVLIPKIVNGRFLTLNTLQELVQKPKHGNATHLIYSRRFVQKELGDQSISKSYWALIIKDVLPNSRTKSYSDFFGRGVSTQQALLKRHYAVPGTLEMVTGILVHYVQSGEKLYSDRPKTFTRCKEKVEGYGLVVGLFGDSGLRVHINHSDGSFGHTGLGALRKF